MLTVSNGRLMINWFVSSNNFMPFNFLLKIFIISSNISSIVSKRDKNFIDFNSSILNFFSYSSFIILLPS